MLDGILARGTAAGTFQPGLTARDVYLIIASLGYFYNSNHHTLSAFLGEPIMSAPAVAHWRDVIQRTVLNAVCHGAEILPIDTAQAPRRPRGRPRRIAS